MANADIARGFTPVNALGANYCGALTRYFIPATDSTAMAVGDFVRYAGSADDDGVPTCVRAAAAQAVVGAIVGFEADKDYESQTHRTASTARYALVADDPGQLFVGQQDGTIAATDIGLNADIVVAAVDTTTGLSGMEIDTSSKNTTATLQVKIIAVDLRPDNEIGASTDCIVKINNHQHGSHTGTAGV